MQSCALSIVKAPMPRMTDFFPYIPPSPARPSTSSWEQALRARLEVLSQDMLDFQDSMLEAVGEGVPPEARVEFQAQLDRLHRVRRAYREDAFLATWDPNHPEQLPVERAHADGWLPTDFLKAELPRTAEELTGSQAQGSGEGEDASGGEGHVCASAWVVM